MNINKVNNWLKTIQNAICPTYCALCDKPTEEALCEICEADLPHLDQACKRCALPLADVDIANPLCGECLVDPPAFDEAIAPFRYAPPIDEMISRFKYQHHLSMGRLLGGYLAQHIVECAATVDALVPIPLHPSRLKHRGFNQAAELAYWVNRRTRIPAYMDLLLRVQPGPDQRSANRKQRQRQVQQAFQIKPAYTHIPERIALIDDVMTTGATARAAASCLRRAGVKYIAIWAIARTGKQEGRTRQKPPALDHHP